MANWLDDILKIVRLPSPRPPHYDQSEYDSASWGRRLQLGCIGWAQDGYGAPLTIYALYILKIFAYVYGWVFFCGFSAGMGDLSTMGDWAFSTLAFQKAILWSMAFEGLGLGCSSGPLSGRYIPPIGGVLYFLRTGTAKLAMFPRLPIIGGQLRRAPDLLLYIAFYAALATALTADTLSQNHMVAIIVSIVILGLADKTIFLCVRAEHYVLTTVCFLFESDWIAGAMAVQIGLWWWAAVSKLNPHFPAVMAVMSSNHPIVRNQWFRRQMYADFPHDLRPSKLAQLMAHAGTALEFTVPILMLLGDGGTVTTLGLIAMVLLHGFITSNFPMAVPIEWNVLILYGSFFLFGYHGHIGLNSIQSPVLQTILVLGLIIIPLIGHLVPRWVSFLLSMRYYAGNWAFGVWLFRRGCFEKLAREMKMVAGHPREQLKRIYGDEVAGQTIDKVIAFRAMHLHGRLLQPLLPMAVDDIDDYEYADGEIIAGLLLGWNFGDGHLHNEQLLDIVQQQCRFGEGDLRCIFVESQPLLGSHHEWRIVDAHSGVLKRGQHPVRDLIKRQPWPVDHNEAFQSKKSTER